MFQAHTLQQWPLLFKDTDVCARLQKLSARLLAHHVGDGYDGVGVAGDVGHCHVQRIVRIKVGLEVHDVVGTAAHDVHDIVGNLAHGMHHVLGHIVGDGSVHQAVARLGHDVHMFVGDLGHKVHMQEIVEEAHMLRWEG